MSVDVGDLVLYDDAVFGIVVSVKRAPLYRLPRTLRVILCTGAVIATYSTYIKRISPATSWSTGG